MRLQKQTHAPYIYLTQDTLGLYHLFVAIPIKNGYARIPATAAEPSVQYLDGMTVVTLKLRDTNAAGPAGDQTFCDYFQLNPIGDSNFAFNPDSEEILVQVFVYETDTLLEEEFSATMLYVDSDDQIPTPGAIQQKMAFNCPYIYLVEVDGRNSSTPQGDGNVWSYEPYILVPLRGYTISPDHILITTPDNGIYEMVLILSNLEGNPLAVDFWYDFNVNRDIYFDSGRVEGNFTATIVLEDNIESSLSLVASPARRIHHSLKEIETDSYPPNGDQAVAGAPTGGAGQPQPLAAPQPIRRRRVRRRRARTRNMSSRRRSPIFLDFREERVLET